MSFDKDLLNIDKGKEYPLNNKELVYRILYNNTLLLKEVLKSNIIGHLISEPTLILIMDEQLKVLVKVIEDV